MYVCMYVCVCVWIHLKYIPTKLYPLHNIAHSYTWMIHHDSHRITQRSIASLVPQTGDSAPSLTAVDGTGVKAAITKDERSLGLSTHVTLKSLHRRCFFEIIQAPMNSANVRHWLNPGCTWMQFLH